jgi:colicin import membrane protein
MSRTKVSVEERERRQIFRWVFLSLFLHSGVIGVFLILPQTFSSRLSGSDVSYSVDLVSADRLQGFGTPPVPGEAESLPKSLAQKEPAPKEAPEVKAEKVSKVREARAKEAPSLRPEARPKLVKVEEMKARESPTHSLESQKIDEKKPAEPTPGERERQLSQAVDQIRAKVVEKEVWRGAIKEREEKEQKEQKITQALDRVRASVTEKGMLHGESGGQGRSGDQGRGTILKSSEVVAYLSLMDRWFKESWIWHGRKELRVTLRFGVKPNGEIVSVRVVESSKDPAFDLSARRAVEKVSPLPPPPSNEFADVTWTFTSEDAKS